MQIRKVLTGVLCASVAVWFSAAAVAQDPKAKPAGEPKKEAKGHDHAGHGHEGHDHGDQADMSEEEMMKAWMAMNATGANHGHLKAMEGTWTTATKWWMSPDAPPSASTGKSVKKLIMGGRFLMEEHNGNMGPDMPFTGIGYTGFDNATQKYQATWMDSMSTGLFMATGTCDASGKSFEYRGEQMCCMTKQMKKYRNVVKVINNDKHVFEMYESTGGAPEFKTLEITYTRG